MDIDKNPADPSLENAQSAPPQNLAVLKGITIGLGVLLVAGMVLVAVRIATMASSDESDPVEAVATAPAGVVSAPLDLATLPPLPLREGDKIASVSAANGVMIVFVEGADPSDQRVMLLPVGGAAQWSELPVARSTE